MYLGLQRMYAYMNIRNFIYVCTLSVVPHLTAAECLSSITLPVYTLKKLRIFFHFCRFLKYKVVILQTG